MAAFMKNSLIKSLLNAESSHRLMNVRCATGLRHSKRRGKLPGVARTFEQRMRDIKLTEHSKPPNVNIGFPVTKTSRAVAQTKAVIRRNRKELLALVQDGKLKLDLDKVDEESWNTNKKEELHQLAEHYGVFRDLFGGATFYPIVNLDVSYDMSDEYEIPVYHGNFITPSQTCHPPSVNYQAESDSLWTLLLTAPDSHLQDNSAEYLHWLVGNIPGNEISKGELLCDYLQVFPVKGTGFHRYVFVLFKQEQTIDFSDDRLTSNTCSLKERTFKTFDFYEKHQDHLTPAGVSFFQSEHDESIRELFWNKLGDCFGVSGSRRANTGVFLEFTIGGITHSPDEITCCSYLVLRSMRLFLLYTLPLPALTMCERGLSVCSMNSAGFQPSGDCIRTVSPG
ncbi:39S ribosomal protein L38, mitochondrial-like isoform X2 [Ostrea edulis]|uniref:39S ribosomal protein L38, mitochondrial-like isoform X2 n=1 Tax=Ostrea edulis TaxID=37623 RepID=UPI0024AE9CB4|nr:39S ribosomal protein L38, mitochondrial-like isoform X2 [Ostrea edulis]